MSQKPLSWRQIVLVTLTLLAVLILGGNLLSSFNQPQIQGELELYQTDLLLEASEWRGDPEVTPLRFSRDSLLGDEPLALALEQYDQARQLALKFLQQAEARRDSIDPSSPPRSDPSIDRTGDLVQKLTLKQGILEAVQGNPDLALERWNSLQGSSANRDPLGGTSLADAPSTQWQSLSLALSKLWSQPPELLPEVETRFQEDLDGWFRYQALKRLYQLQQRTQALDQLQAQNQTIAQQALVKLFLLAGLPILGSVMGGGILVFLLIQSWLGRNLADPNQASSDNRTGIDRPWQVPWGGEMIWQVLIGGFFFVGQILVAQILSLLASPLLIPLFGLLGLSTDPQSIQFKAVSVLLVYGIMALSVLGFLYWSLRPYLPLPPGWFPIRWRDHWIGWGIAGYLMGLPLVILTSLVNQQIWQGQGGSNPILSLALENQDRIALACFFITAAIAAPLFEEFLFRGFLMASLSRYFPGWGAISLSALLFALAHLNLSEVLPLFVLGMVLGYVYGRSRNLLAPMLLHSLWNSGTLLGLFLLGS